MITGTGNFENACLWYEKICLYCGIAAAVFLLLTVILFFILHIPQVFGELTGRTARRAVRKITDSNLQRDKAAALSAAQRMPAAFMAETAALPTEKRRVAGPGTEAYENTEDLRDSEKGVGDFGRQGGDSHE